MQASFPDNDCTKDTVRFVLYFEGKSNFLLFGEFIF